MAVTRLLMISPNAADLMLEKVAQSLTEHVYFIWQSTSSPPRDSSLRERLHDTWSENGQDGGRKSRDQLRRL